MKKTLQCTCLLLGATVTFANTGMAKSANSFMRPSVAITAEINQEIIRGTVKDNTGTSLIGVTVVIKGTKVGTQTDVNGQFSLNAKQGDILVFSFIGYLNQEITVGTSKTVNVSLAVDNHQLNEVVVTALGIKKATKSLTYNVQTLNSNAVNDVKDPSFVNSLTGKVAGLTLTHSSAPGGSTKAILRGNKSINGNNNALYVVDGVPLPNLSSSNISDGFNITDNGDGISNLNPDDIEEVSVLSGASAAALYGGQAANGAILITTKKGKSGRASVNFNSSVTFDNPLIMPKIQTVYGATDRAKPDDPLPFNGWNLTKAASPSGYDPKDFFDTGKTYTNALSISGGTEKNQSYFSAAATNANGIIPNNKLDRYNFSFKNTTLFFNDKLKLDAAVDYTYQKALNMPGQGTYFNPLTGIYLFPSASVDFNQYKNYETFDPVRKINVQNWPQAYFINDLALQNPYWVVNRNLFENQRNRVLASVTAKYDFTSYLNLQGRMKIDRTTDFNTQKLYASTAQLLTKDSNNGAYKEINDLNNQTYADLLLNFSKTFNDFSLNATLGTSILNTSQRTTSIGGGLDPFKVPNFFSLYNLALNKIELNPTPAGYESRPYYRNQNQAVFLTATLGYKNYLFLDVTGRNDWNSSLPQPSFFYPSVGLSAVVSEMVKLPEAISFAKLRLSYAEVGNAVPPQFAYAGNPSYPISTGGITLSNGLSLGNDLKPEKTKSFEVGADLKFMANKLNLTATYYRTNTFNQFFRVPAAPSSGYTYYDFNAGQVRNQGMEASLSYNANFDEFRWTPTVNFSFNRNKVVSLLHTTDPKTGAPIDVSDLNLTGSSSATSSGTYVHEGGAYGDIRINDFVRDASGNIVLDASGLPQFSDNFIIAGNTNPKYQMSFNNGFNYKNFSLNFLVDGRFGGNVISYTEMTLDKYGMSQRTADNRDANTQKYYSRIAGEQSKLSPSYIYSATNIRLRELAFGYTIPGKVFDNKIQNVKLSVIGRNLWMIYNKAPFDPEVVTLTGNGFQGADNFSVPSLRSIGFSLKITL